MKELVLEELESEAGKLEKHVEDDFGTGKFAEYQKCLWNLMEKPDTSRSNIKNITSLKHYLVISELQKRSHSFRSCLFWSQRLG